MGTFSRNGKERDEGWPHHWEAGEVVASLKTDAHTGLTSDDARTRLESTGRNELAREAPPPRWKKFLGQFKDVLVLLLLVATAISAAVWAMDRTTAWPYEALAILVVVLLNAMMGYTQEARAESAVAALRKMSAAQADVVRDGSRVSIPTAEVVPGDILVIEEGDTIPADGRLIEEAAMHTAEAALTGESQPVAKETIPVEAKSALGDRSNMVFSGTIATYGHGRAVVTATGMDTEMGRIAGLLKEHPAERTPLQRELDVLGKRLGMIVVAIAVVMIATIVFTEEVRGVAGLLKVLILGVALAVAAVPEGLPAVVTAVLALGVQRMARRNAIVRHLAAVETLGAADVIASDKTGTLTRNEMTVRTVVTASGRVNFGGTGYLPKGEVSAEGGRPLEAELRHELERALIAADRANNATLEEGKAGVFMVQGDPTEGALIVAARKAGLTRERLETALPRVGEVPFSSERKLMSTVHEDGQRENGRLRVFTKGAPDVLLARCTHELAGNSQRLLTEERKREILRVNEELAGQALRTLGVAEREMRGGAAPPNGWDDQVEQDLVFLGLIGMIDPPREEVKPAVARALSAGIRPVMITGDHPRTAARIAAELGISHDDRVVTGAELDAATESALREIVEHTTVYARVNPEHKLRIVKAMKQGGATVAMTGDGVNDAPALQAADIGVAMGIAGTDVSKEAADMVLTDDNFATIVEAVSEGRSIFANIRKFLRYLLSSNMGEVLTMFLGVVLADLIGLRLEGNALVLPLVATQILWINLVTDGAPALALGVDPSQEELMHVAPRPRHEGVITRKMWRGIFWVGGAMAAGTLLVLDASLPGGLLEGSGDLRYGQTMAFTTLMLFQVFNAFNARSDERSAFHGLFHNPWLWGALALSVLLQVAVVYLPFLQQAFSTVALSGKDWAVCAGVASSVLWLRELNKLLIRQRSSGSGVVPMRGPHAK